MEEAKAELADLKGSDDEAIYGEGPTKEGAGSQAEGSESILVGQKRSRDQAQNQEMK